MRRIFTLCVSVFTLLFSVVSAHAQTVTQDTATATNLGLYGGQIRYIAVDATSDYMYVGAYAPNGIFISPDNGATWTAVPDTQDFGEPRGVFVNDLGDVFVLANEGVFKSTDHGATFTNTSEDIGRYAGTGAYANDTLVIGRTDGGVSVSTDDGETYTTTSVVSGANVTSVALSPTLGTGYAVFDVDSTTQLYKTTDGGANWSAVSTTSVTDDFYLVAVDPNDANHIILTVEAADAQPWHSLDGGSTWSQLDVTPAVTKISFDSTGRMYLGVDYSDDNGQTWSQVTQATPISRVSGIVVPDPENDSILYAGSFAALATSTDRGVSWTDSNEGITAVTITDIGQSIDKNTVWLATGSGLAKTENFLDEANRTWEFPIYYDSYPRSVWVSPEDTDTVVVGGRGAIVKTTDGGDTWTTATGWDTDLTPTQIIHDTTTPTTLYAAGNVQDFQDFKTGGVYTSTDGGSSWVSMAFPESYAAQSIALSSDGSLYVGTGNLEINSDGETGLYRYKDGAWTKFENAPAEEITSILVDAVDANVLYITAAEFNTYGAEADTISGFYKSEDAGENWTRVTTGLEDATKFIEIGVQTSTTPTTLYLSGKNKLTSAGEIYKSADGGDTWGLYYTGLKNEVFNTLLFDGLIAGTLRGAYGLQSFADITLKAKPKTVPKGEKTTLTITLKDAATGKKLKNRKVVLLRKVGKSGTFKRFKAVTTNKKGVAVVRAKVVKNTFFKARFTPKKTIDIEEFTTSTSNVVKITI